MTSATDEIELLRREVKVLSARMLRAEEQAETATTVALSTIDTQKGLVAACEAAHQQVNAAHTQMTEMLASVKRMSGTIEVLARMALDRASNVHEAAA